MKIFLIAGLLLSGLWSYAQQQHPPGNNQGNPSTVNIPAKLVIPFGTIAKLDVEIFDGDNLRMKSYQGTYLLKINSVNDKKQMDTLLMTFEDETGELANDNFQLYKLLYGKKINSASSSQIDKMKKSYVGKKMTLMSYETGHFTGIPKDYDKYRPIIADRSFHFENYLVIVSVVTK